jgi:hypothetical protein
MYYIIIYIDIHIIYIYIHIIYIYIHIIYIYIYIHIIYIYVSLPGQIPFENMFFFLRSTSFRLDAE